MLLVRVYIDRTSSDFMNGNHWGELTTLLKNMHSFLNHHANDLTARLVLHRLASPGRRSKFGWDLAWLRGRSSSSLASPSPPPTPTRIPELMPTLRFISACEPEDSLVLTSAERFGASRTLASERKRRSGWAKPRRIYVIPRKRVRLHCQGPGRGRDRMDLPSQWQKENYV